MLQLYLDGPRDKFFYIFSKNEKTKSNTNNNLFDKVLNKANSPKVLEDQKNAMISLLKKKNSIFVN